MNNPTITTTDRDRIVQQRHAEDLPPDTLERLHELGRDHLQRGAKAAAADPDLKQWAAQLREAIGKAGVRNLAKEYEQRAGDQRLSTTDRAEAERRAQILGGLVRK